MPAESSCPACAAQSRKETESHPRVWRAGTRPPVQAPASFRTIHSLPSLDRISPIFARPNPQNPVNPVCFSASRYRAHNKEGLGPFRDCIREGGVRRIVRHVFATDKESDHRPALVRFVIANCSAQHRIIGFECVEKRLDRDSTVKIDMYLVAHARERTQMMRKDDTDHIENSKSEFRSTKQISNSEIEMCKTSSAVFVIVP